MVIELFKVSPKIFENHEPIKSPGFFYFNTPLPTPLSSLSPLSLFYFNNLLWYVMANRDHLCVLLTH